MSDRLEGHRIGSVNETELRGYQTRRNWMVVYSDHEIMVDHIPVEVLPRKKTFRLRMAARADRYIQDCLQDGKRPNGTDLLDTVLGPVEEA